MEDYSTENAACARGRRRQRERENTSHTSRIHNSSNILIKMHVSLLYPIGISDHISGIQCGAHLVTAHQRGYEETVSEGEKRHKNKRH